MARRRRRAAHEAGEVPAELAEPALEFWADPEAVAELALACGIDPADVEREHPPALPTIPTARFEAFRTAWAAARGMVVEPTGRHPRPDLARLEAAGVCVGRAPDLFHRRLYVIEAPGEVCYHRPTTGEVVRADGSPLPLAATLTAVGR